MCVEKECDADKWENMVVELVKIAVACSIEIKETRMLSVALNIKFRNVMGKLIRKVNLFEWNKKQQITVTV